VAISEYREVDVMPLIGPKPDWPAGRNGYTTWAGGAERPYRQMDTMDGRHFILLATGTRTIRMPVGEAEGLVEFSRPAFGLPPSRCRTPSGGVSANKDQRPAQFSRRVAIHLGVKFCQIGKIGQNCPPSALVGQIRQIEEGSVSGSS
jgi:hypothetical protein